MGDFPASHGADDTVAGIGFFRDGPGWDSEVSFSNWAPQGKSGSFQGIFASARITISVPQKKMQRRFNYH